MSDSLRDQLLGLGFKPAPKPDKPARPDRGKAADNASRRPHQNKPHPDAPNRGGPNQGRPHQNRPNPNKPQPGRPSQGKSRHDGKPRSQEEIDLAKAYAIRAQREKDERIAAERLKQEEARKRREA